MRKIAVPSRAKFTLGQLIRLPWCYVQIVSYGGDTVGGRNYWIDVIDKDFVVKDRCRVLEGALLQSRSRNEPNPHVDLWIDTINQMNFRGKNAVV